MSKIEVMLLVVLLPVVCSAEISPASGLQLTAEAQRQKQHGTERQLLEQDIIRLSGLLGLSQQARHLAQAILNAQKVPLGYQYQVAGLVTQYWRPEIMQQRLHTTLAEFDKQQLKHLRMILSDSVLQGAREKEVSAVNMQAGLAYKNYMKKLRQTSPSPSRMSLVKSLDGSMHFSTLMMRVRASVYSVLEQVLTGWKPQENWMKALQINTQAFLMYAHRSTPSNQLKELLALYNDQTLQKWLEQVAKTIDV